MPSEITLGKSMPVRCRGKVTRVAQLSGAARTGVAVHLEGYDYLPEAAPVTEVSSYGRMSVSDDFPQEEEVGASAHTFNFKPAVI
jgi:hypothetical protein